MRLTPEQQAAIRSAATEAFGPGVAVWLFGSRVDEARRGGDIDLLVRPVPMDMGQVFGCKIRMLTLLEQRLGERKIDLVVETPEDHRPIVTIAHQTGVQLQ